MSSSIPGAVQYWVNLATTTLASTPLAPDGVLVWFGAALSKYTAPITLQVLGVYNIVHQWANVGSEFKVEESYKIRNQLVSYSGGLNNINRMTDVFSTLSLLTVATATDYTLGGNVRLCLPMVAGEYVPGSDPTGKIAGSLMFDVHCEARIRTLT